jgi:putative membrane protein
MTLSEPDRDRLQQLIAAGEARTSAELVLVVADCCGGYRLFALLWPALAALVIGGLLAAALPHLAGARVFLAESGVFIAVAAGLQWQPGLLRVVPAHVRRAHAQQIAEHQFALRVAGRTPARTGVLLFVALAERQVFVLPDAGIAAVVPVSIWQEVVERLVRETRSRPPAQAIAVAVEEILGALEQRFPATGQPRNVLPDQVVELGDARVVDAGPADRAPGK